MLSLEHSVPSKAHLFFVPWKQGYHLFSSVHNIKHQLDIGNIDGHSLQWKLVPALQRACVQEKDTETSNLKK